MIAARVPGRIFRVALIGSAFWVSSAFAVDWETRASVSPSVTYTDNVCLDNDNKKDDFIGSLTPSGSLHGESPRSSLTLNGSVSLNTLTNSALNHQGCGGDFDDRQRPSRLVGGRCLDDRRRFGSRYVRLCPPLPPRPRGEGERGEGGGDQ